jgi:hypothetical protein
MNEKRQREAEFAIRRMLGRRTNDNH